MSPPDGPPFGWRRHAGGPPGWVVRRRFLFFRFARYLILLLALFLLAMGGLAFLLTRLFGGGGGATLLVWLVSLGLALSFPIAVGFSARTFFTRVISPLASVMTAADAVAAGDLSVRVPEGWPGEFGRLARAFNRMVAELEVADRQRRNLTADVAHELRTPLHIIQGNLEGILDGVYRADSAQVSLLLEETRQLARLVEDLSTLSLAEAGQLNLMLERVNVDELLADVVTSFSGQAETARVKLNLVGDPEKGSLFVTGDARRLDQVLSNLVANALRHTPAGGEVHLRAGATPAGVRIQVADSGSGIPEEDLPHIFDRFWSGDSPQDGHNGQGSGLGLAIARQLVEAHGGHIHAESRPGQGTTFSIDLPAGKAG